MKSYIVRVGPLMKKAIEEQIKSLEKDGISNVKSPTASDLLVKRFIPLRVTGSNIK